MKRVLLTSDTKTSSLSPALGLYHRCIFNFPSIYSSHPSHKRGGKSGIPTLQRTLLFFIIVYTARPLLTLTFSQYTDKITSQKVYYFSSLSRHKLKLTHSQTLPEGMRTTCSAPYSPSWIIWSPRRTRYSKRIPSSIESMSVPCSKPSLTGSLKRRNIPKKCTQDVS